MTDDAIVVEGLEKSYGSVHALRGVDFAARTGSILGLLGPNGAGKTTAVRILTTLLEADAGTARVAGLDVRRDAAALREKIGLAMLSLEFVWAERLLEKSLEHAQIAQEKAAQTTRTQRVLAAIATALAIAACVLAILWWDVPLLPDS